MHKILMDIEAEKTSIQSHIDKGNYHAGMNLAISAMNACRCEENQKGVDIFIDVMKNIIAILSDEFGSKQ